MKQLILQRATLIVPLTLLLTSATMSAADGLISTSPKGWRLSVQTNKRKYAPGEEIILVATLMNETRHSMSVIHRSLLRDYRVTIRCGSDVLPFDDLAFGKYVDGSAFSHTVQGQTSLKSSVSVREIISSEVPLKPGHYSVEVIKDFRGIDEQAENAHPEAKDILSGKVEFEILNR